MSLRMEVGLAPGHIVLFVDPARAVASGVLGGAEHPRAVGAAPVLRMASSTPS